MIVAIGVDPSRALVLSQVVLSFGIPFALIPLILWRKKHLPASDWEARLPYKACLGAGLFLFAAAAFQQIGLQYTSSAHSGFKRRSYSTLPTSR